MAIPERSASRFTAEAYGIQRTVLRSVPSPDPDATLPIVSRKTVEGQAILPMKCLSCEGPVQRSTVPVTFQRYGYRLSWEAVPAWVCTRCGISYFEKDEVERMHEAARAVASAQS